MGIFREAIAAMNFIDCLVLTFANMALCLSLPKLLSLLTAPKTRKLESIKPALSVPIIESEAPRLLQIES